MSENLSTRTCVKIENLRKLHGSDINLRKWLEDKDNVYCGRRGRIFINKEIFHYNESKWANPFTIKKYTLDECIDLYYDYITKKIEENPEYFDLYELKGKNLGCWCNSVNKCHVDILIKLIKIQNSEI